MWGAVVNGAESRSKRYWKGEEAARERVVNGRRRGSKKYRKGE